jgi:hypothetical protein
MATRGVKHCAASNGKLADVIYRAPLRDADDTTPLTI